MDSTGTPATRQQQPVPAVEVARAARAAGGAASQLAALLRVPRSWRGRGWPLDNP